MIPLLQGLAARAGLQHRVALVVAHPDDETVAAGGSLHLMPGLLLVHVTDGAPRRLDDAREQGFDTPEAYAAAREAELQDALAVAGVAPERVRLGVPDQDAALHMRAIAAELETLFARHGIEAVLTHAYEGGHPDHDSTALAVCLAARRSGIPVFEFAGYHAGAPADDAVLTSASLPSSLATSPPGLTRGSLSSGDPEGRASAPASPLARHPRIKSVDDVRWATQPRAMTVQRFLPGPPETLVTLLPHEATQKQAMLDRFHTQSGILRLFSPGTERFRPAPSHDFRQPPHPGPLNYERWGWEMTGTRWRSLAAAALEGSLACAG